MQKNNQTGQRLNGPESEPNEFASTNSMNLGDMLEVTPKNKVASIDKTRNEEVQRPVNQENRQLDSIAQNNQEIERFFQQQVDKKFGFWEKMNNRPMYNEVQQIKHELLKSSAKYRLGFYKTLLDARLECLNEKCDAGVKMIKGHFRQQVSSFLMAKMEQMTVEVKDRQIKFLEMMKGKYQYAEGLDNYPSMQKRYLDSIFEEEGRYLKFLDSLLLRFESIVDEQLEKY